MSSLTVVIPVYNGSEWILKTIDRARQAVDASGWAGSPILVVDDGSTDGTGAALDARAQVDPRLHVVHTTNQGRFLARRTGIEAAECDYVLLLDTRVLLNPGSLEFLTRAVQEPGGGQVWNGHVEIDTSRNRYARFWQAITFVAWRRYLANPRPVSFGLADFDHYPKGTGCFFAPRQLLLDSYAAFSSHYDDLRRVNDDTSLIRTLAAAAPIHIDPRFGCVYHARGNLKGFLTHAFFRGVHFVDGYLRPGTRFFVPLLLLLVATPLYVLVLVLRPLLAIGAAATGLVAVFVSCLILGVAPRTAAWFTILLPGFATVYLAGLWRGLALMLATRLKKP